MNGPEDSMAYYERLFHSPPPTVDYVASLLSARSVMRVNQNQRKKSWCWRAPRLTHKVPRGALHQFHFSLIFWPAQRAGCEGETAWSLLLESEDSFIISCSETYYHAMQSPKKSAFIQIKQNVTKLADVRVIIILLCTKDFLFSLSVFIWCKNTYTVSIMKTSLSQV